MISTVVTADQSMPKCLARTGQSHGQWKKRQQDTVRVIVTFGKGFVGSHSREVVNIAGPCQAHDRMKQQNPVDRLDCSFRKFLMDSMQRITRLKCHDVFAT